MKKLIRKIKKYITLKRGKLYIDEKGIMTFPNGCKIEVFSKDSYDESYKHYGNSVKINEVE